MGGKFVHEEDSHPACRVRDATRDSGYGVGERPSRERHLTGAGGKLRDAHRHGFKPASDVFDHRLLQEWPLARTGPLPTAAEERSRQLDLDGRDPHDTGNLADLRLMRIGRDPTYGVPSHLATAIERRALPVRIKTWP
jgi:hypothetical protein